MNLRPDFFPLVLAPGLASPAAAQTLWVATNGDDGTGDGSAGDPWATIEHALSEVPDGSLILVRPGTYNGRVRLDEQFAGGVTVRSGLPYRARLRHDATVVTCFYGQGITLEGFDVAHSGSGAGALVIRGAARRRTARPLPAGVFADGSTSIRGVFERLVALYGAFPSSSPLRDSIE